MAEGTRYAGSLAVASTVALCLLVGGVGFVALLAEFQQSWTAYHFMERTVEGAAPVAVVLAVATVLAGLLAVVRAG